MKLVITLLFLAVLLTASATIGMAVWDGRIGHRDSNMRPIHYDTNYNVSSQRRVPKE